MAKQAVILGFVYMAANFPSHAQTSWQGTNGTWDSPTNWSNGIPTNESPRSVYFTGTYATHPTLGADRTVVDFVQDRAVTLIPNFSGGYDLYVTGSLAAVTGELQFRSNAGSSLTIDGNFNINSTVQFGNRGTTGGNTQFGNVSVGGVTNVAAQLYFSNPGTVNLGRLSTSSGGIVHVTAGSGDNGTGAGNTNLITVSSLSGTAGTIQATKAGTIGHLSVNGTSSGTFGGAIVNSAGTMMLSKSNSGTLALTAANTYTGTTTITGGTLLLSGTGSINGTSGIALSGGNLVQNSSTALSAPITWTGGTISGSSTISGNLTASGGGTKSLNPGNSPGELTVTGDLTLDNLTTLNIELNGTTPIALYDVLSIGNALTLGNAALNVTVGYAAQINDEFFIANFTSLSGTFNGLSDGSTFSSGGYSFQIDYNTEDIRLMVTAIPEPQAAVLLAAGGVALMVFRRRFSGK